MGTAYIDTEPHFDRVLGRLIMNDRWRWTGDPHGVASFSLTMAARLPHLPNMQHGAVIQANGLRLRVVGVPAAWRADVMQDGWLARLVAAWWPVGFFLRQVEWRIIATLAIWGLAAFSAGMAPTWGDVYAVAALRKVFREISAWAAARISAPSLRVGVWLAGKWSGLARGGRRLMRRADALVRLGSRIVRRVVGWWLRHMGDDMQRWK